MAELNVNYKFWDDGKEVVGSEDMSRCLNWINQKQLPSHVI